MTTHPLMAGRLDDVDVPTLLETVSAGTWHVLIDIFERAAGAEVAAQPPIGSIHVANGNVVWAHTRGREGIEALVELLELGDGYDFIVVRIVGSDLRSAPVLASVRAIVSGREKAATEARDTRG